METETKTTVSLDKKSFPGSLGFDELRFVLLARSTDVTRYFLNVLHVEDVGDGKRIAVCTDGRRMHIWKTDKLGPMGITPGDWHVEKCTKARIELTEVPEGTTQFPNWERVVPQDTGDPIDFDLGGPYRDTLLNLGREYARIVRTWGTIFNLEYLRDLQGYFWMVQADQDSPNRAHMFEHKTLGLTAIIMPMMPDK